MDLTHSEMEIYDFIWWSYYLNEQRRRAAESGFIGALSAMDRLSDLPGDEARAMALLIAAVADASAKSPRSSAVSVAAK